MTFFSGRVNTVIFSNEEQVFYVLRMKLDEEEDEGALDDLMNYDFEDGEDTVTVRGHVPGLPIKIGTWFGFEGEWTNHPKYGRQIKIEKAPLIQGDWDTEQAASMLVSNGVSSLMVRQLRKHFGDDLISALGDPERLREVQGVSKFSADHIASKWETLVVNFKVLGFLADLEIPPSRVTKIWATFGDRAEHVLSHNPWELVKIEGFKFSQADEIARKLGLDMNGPSRIQGAALYAAKERKGMGHLYLRSGDVLGTVQQFIPDVQPAEVAAALKDLFEGGHLVVDRETRPGHTAIYEPWSHEVEQESAWRLVRRVKGAALDGEELQKYIRDLSGVGPKTLKVAEGVSKGLDTEEEGWQGALIEVAKAAIREWGSMSKLKLSPDQEQGVLHGLTEPVSIITGLPGTGKTTSLRVLVRVLQTTDIPFLLVAPTGIAAKRLESVTGSKAKTIHRAFGAQGVDDSEDRQTTYAGIVESGGGAVQVDGSQEIWGFDREHPHPAQFVIIDESSMVDQALLYRVLDCTGENCRVVFVGDAAQLPSVGPGNVLRDLVKSEAFPTVNLTEIFRQEDTSDIVYAAHEIFGGRTPKTSLKSDFALIPLSDENQVLETVLKLADRMYARRDNFQVISPRHAGTVGVTNLNTRLRELLNPKEPGKHEERVGNGVIREGDRVMIVKNNYKLGVYNGDVGKVEAIYRNSKKVEIKIFGPVPLLVMIDFRDVATYVRLAYACTVHKAQGQEYDNIVMPILPSFKHQLQRNLLYTAVTRARRKVVLIGSSVALGTAVDNNKEDARNTLFIDRLLKGFSEGVPEPVRVVEAGDFDDVE